MDGYVHAVVSKDELLKAIRQDCVTFFSFYLEDELTLEVPEVHKEIWQELLSYLEIARDPKYVKGILKKLFCVPRGHAKSTVAKLAVILFLRYSPFRFVIYASNTIAVAIQAIRDIVKWFALPQDDQLYPGRPIKWIEKANQSEGIWILHIPTPDYGVKRVILKALGSESQVRGTLIDNLRPELAIIDDCEDLNTANTEETQAKLDAWLLGSLMKAFAKRALVIMIGNMISERTLIRRLSSNTEWRPTVFGAIVRHKSTKKLMPLWPGLYTVAELLKEYQEYRKLGRGHIWAHEMMNLTSEKIFGMEMDKIIQIPTPNPDMIECGAIMLDPAFGENSWNDKTAITVHVQIKPGFYGHGIPHIVSARHHHWTEEEMLDELIALSVYWGIKTWIIEAVSAQKLYLPYFRTAMKLRKMNPDHILMIPIQGTQDKGAKKTRVLAFKSSVVSGNYGIAIECDELLNAIATYNPEANNKKTKDDLPDSASFGTILWDMHGSVIESAGVSHMAMLLFNQATVRGNINQLQTAPM